MVSVCVGLWIWNVCVWYCVYGSGVSSLVSACINPHGSLSSPRVVSVVVSSCVTSPLSSVVPLRRLHLGISTLASAFVLRPSTFGSSSVVLVVCWALAWTLDRRRGVLSQMQVLALRVVF